MKIIENLTSLNHQNEIENALQQYAFPWHYMSGTTAGKNYPDYNEYKNIKVCDPPQFTHIFRDDANFIDQYYPLIYPLILMAEKELNLNLVNNLYRAKANFLLPEITFPNNSYHYPHQDLSVVNSILKVRTLLYYVNDSDGDTVIFNEKNPKVLTLTEKERITPKKGRAIFFDSTYLHCSTSPRKNNRYVINIVFKY